MMHASRGQAEAVEPPRGADLMVDHAGDDASLIAGLKAGSEEAYEGFVRRYADRIYNIARGMTQNSHDAEEVVQDTFLSVFKGIRSFKGDAALSTWTYRIAVNAALMRIRRQKSQAPTICIDDCMPTFDETGHRVASLPDWHPRADEILLNSEMGSLLWKAIGALPTEYRTVLVLRDQEGLTNEDVAAVMRLSVAAVKSRLHRARIAVREQVKGYVLAGAGDAVEA